MYDRNVILRYLDSPTRIAFWTTDEMSALFLPISLGCLFKFPMTGLVLSILTYAALRYVKQYIGGGFLRHAFYWYLPGMHKSMRLRIPSHVREYIG
ncbi:type IV conjugative transfer system protein TraL [Rickettsiales endosymbiont of Peranema trichophorum]|uniref:type IV conjugative transfer system protein TraL n=1 Tax=Rickettsiales endosymbiont of Peranema trichophorum TaxID=2486577 RepID=UPI0013EE674F|nr:type IV conjugative transfer system protein TraL [Rickettsiales endosymbiont of Peranema trichophorum]